MEAMVNEVMASQVEVLCEQDGNLRNRYRERKLVTSAGEITMRIPETPSRDLLSVVRLRPAYISIQFP